MTKAYQCEVFLKPQGVHQRATFDVMSPVGALSGTGLSVQVYEDRKKELRLVYREEIRKAEMSLCSRGLLCI